MSRQLCLVHLTCDRCTDDRWTIFISRIILQYDHRTDKTETYEQERKYDQFITWLEERDIYIPIKHVSNSASIIDLDGFRKDMVRSGIITYGLYPSEEVSKDVLDLRPAMELKTHIVYIKEVEAGEGISYNHTYVTDKKTKIATIPVGYADGYPRSLSSKGKVLIRGQYAPIIGRICMDQFMVDVMLQYVLWIA